MMSYQTFKTLKKATAKAETLQNAYELAQNKEQHIHTFQDYFQLYQRAEETSDRSALKELLQKATGVDLKTLNDWHEIAESVNDLEDKGLITIEPSKLNTLTANAAFAIVAAAWDNLMQFQEQQEPEQEQERSR